jgi:transcriptional regulator with XRE-family HTH domain
MVAKGKYQEWIEEEKLLLLSGWARAGLTDEQIASNMGIAYSTLRLWKEKYSALSAALKKGKEVADYQVENSLFKRAIGYEYIEEKTETNANGEERITGTIKHVIPDTTAQIFWLKNRRPDKWRDKPPVNDSNDEQINRNIQSIAELLNNPVANRDIKDLE